MITYQLKLVLHVISFLGRTIIVYIRFAEFLHYCVALNFCGSLIFQTVGDFLCFAGTNFCDWRTGFSCWELTYAIFWKSRSNGTDDVFVLRTCNRNADKID